MTTSPFARAIKALNPGPIFKTCTTLYADRKIVLVISFHLVATFICYSHFSLSKFNSQDTKVPAAAPFRSWKVGVPTFEFGTMHAILFQMALMPLTMCRLLIATLSKTFLAKYIPFSEMTRYHIVIGYVFVFLLFITVVVFLMFFGRLCASGDENFCKKFTTEIIITGYVIFVAFMSVGISSALRHKIKYRVFYVLHHLVFAAYLLTILHTIDNVERQKGGRSQAFKWFSASLLLYISDRASMYLSHRYHTHVVTAYTIDSEVEDRRLIILKAKKPDLLHFCPGQYAYLKVPKVDNLWHPFSIGSGPESDLLCFYIKVYNAESWSGRLFKVLQKELEAIEGNDELDLDVDIEVLGPYGTPLAKSGDYTHATMFGTGTGFVPCMSAMEDHVNQCLALDPVRYEKYAEKRRTVARALSVAQNAATEKSTFSILNTDKIDVGSMLEIAAGIINNASVAKRKIVLHVLFLMAPVFGLATFGLTMSWNQLPFELYKGMSDGLMACTFTFQVLFVASAFFQKSGGIYWSALDNVVAAISIVADWYWTSKSSWGDFRDEDLVYYTILIGYMIVRLFGKGLEDAVNKNVTTPSGSSGPILYEKFTFIWSCRSAELIAQAFPDISHLWDELVESWGEEEAHKKLDIVIRCTDSDEADCQKLIDGIQDTDLYKNGCIKFGRPWILQMLEKNAMEKHDNNYPTKSLFAFCGSAVIAKQLKQAKVLSDLVLSMTGNTTHGTDLVVETYGSYSAASRLANTFDEPPSHPFTIIPSINHKTDSMHGSAIFSRRTSVSFSSGFARASESLRQLDVDAAKSDGSWLVKKDFIEDEDFIEDHLRSSTWSVLKWGKG